MAIEAHLKTLKNKHQKLETALEHALAAPSIDDLFINELKRKKLQIKDEIAQIQMKRA